MNREEVIQIIKEELANLLAREKYVFQNNIQIFDNRNIQLGRTTGTMIGTDIDQKLGFYGKTPVIKQNTVADPTGGAVVDAQARGAINEIIDRLQIIGIIK